MTKKTWLILGAMALILITVGYFHYKPAAKPSIQVVEQPAPAAHIEHAEVVVPVVTIAAPTNDANLVKTRINGMKFAAAAVPVARPAQNGQ